MQCLWEIRLTDGAYFFPILSLKCYQKNNIAPYRGSDRNRPRRGEDSSHISRLTQPKAKKSRWDVARSPSRCTSLQTPFGADNWPPNFEGYGSLYIFDPRCGMFYEPASNFFYDPTTKLYYSSKKGTYFQFDESKIPAFQAVKCTPEGAESSHAVHNTESEAFENNSKIELKIKPKKAKNLKPVTEARLPEIVLNQAQKKQLALMDQWSEKAKVTKAVSDRTLKKKRSALGGTASTVQDHGEVRKTAHGEPLCLLCLRKFTSVEKLRLHEMGSLLHEENSAKKSSLGKRNAAGSSEHLR